MTKKLLMRGGLAIVLLLVLAQLFRPDRTNPATDPAASFEAVANPPKEVVAIIERSCRDCHTDRTVWPWYSNIAPISWMVASDVHEGRSKLNFSRWNIYSPEMTLIRMRRVCVEVTAGEMPLFYYLPMHPQAKLTARDVDTLCSMAKKP